VKVTEKKEKSELAQEGIKIELKGKEETSDKRNKEAEEKFDLLKLKKAS